QRGSSAGTLVPRSDHGCWWSTCERALCPRDLAIARVGDGHRHGRGRQPDRERAGHPSPAARAAAGDGGRGRTVVRAWDAIAVRSTSTVQPHMVRPQVVSNLVERAAYLTQRGSVVGVL